MLNNNSNKIRQVKRGAQMLQSGKAGGANGRPRLLHNGINGQKGGTNAKGTPKKAVLPGRTTVDPVSQAVNVLRKKKRP